MPRTSTARKRRNLPAPQPAFQPEIQATVKALTAVVTPYAAANRDHDNPLELSDAQKNSVRDVMADWEASCDVSPTLSSPLVNQIVSFLHTKRDTFSRALQDKRALTFDVILLGVVSCTVPYATNTGQTPAKIRALCCT